MNPSPVSSNLPMMRGWAVLVVFLMLGLVACGDDPPVTYPTAAQFNPNQYVLGPGDKIELTIFYGTKEQKATYSLDASGQMEVQFIGSVAAGGKNATDVKEEIQKRLADGYLNSPVVSLNIIEINSLKCSVFGQVAKSGTIKYVPGMTIVEAIAVSGGFSPLARKNMVRVTRTVSGKKETYKLPVEMMGEGRRPNFPMMPGDEVFVPERNW